MKSFRMLELGFVVFGIFMTIYVFSYAISLSIEVHKMSVMGRIAYGEDMLVFVGATICFFCYFIVWAGLDFIDWFVKARKKET